MNNLKKAKELLKDSQYTCVLCKDDTIYTSTLKGISPMVEFLRNGINLKGFSAADKIVGKAAAMLFSLVEVKEVYAEVLSKSAAEYLSDRNIAFSYDTLTDKIINRKGDGICPMEKTVADLTDEMSAFEAIKNKLNELRKESLT